MTVLRKTLVCAVIIFLMVLHGCASPPDKPISRKDLQMPNIQGRGNMTIQENKNIARRFIQIWGKGNLDVIDELGDPSISVQYPVIPQVIRGTQMFRQVMQGWRAAFPDADLVIEEEVAEGDKVALRWSFSGTHQGNLLGIPATGKKVKWTGITIYRIINGKVVEEKGEEDFLGFLRQIGLVPQA